MCELIVNVFKDIWPQHAANDRPESSIPKSRVQLPLSDVMCSSKIKKKSENYFINYPDRCQNRVKSADQMAHCLSTME